MSAITEEELKTSGCMYSDEAFTWYMTLFSLDDKLEIDALELPPPARKPRKSRDRVLSDYHPKIKKE
jgi:hypothetical protein